jgi:hypothetical protein
VHGTVSSIGAAVQVLVGLSEFEPMLNILPPELLKNDFK